MNTSQVDNQPQYAKQQKQQNNNNKKRSNQTVTVRQRMAASNCSTACTLGGAGFGSVGVCIEKSAEVKVPFCQCPDGFSGHDDWGTYDDCHIDERTRLAMHMLVLATSLLALIVSVTALRMLRSRWSFGRQRVASTGSRLMSLARSPGRYVATLRQSQGTDPNFDNRSQYSATSTPLASQRMSIVRAPRRRSGVMARDNLVARKWRKQRNILIVLYIYVLFAATCVTAYALALLGYANSIAYMVLVATFSPSVLASMWMLGYTWYKSMPSVRVFGSMFAERSILSHFPNLVMRAMLTNITLAYITSHLLLWGLPLAFPEHRQTFQLAFVYAMAGFVLVYCIVLHWICSLLRSCFMQLDEASNRRQDVQLNRRSVRFEDDSVSTPNATASKFSQASATINKTIKLNVLVGGATIGVAICTALLSEMHTNMYIVYSAAALTASIYTVVNTMVFLVRSGELSSLQRERTSSGVDTRDMNSLGSHSRKTKARSLNNRKSNKRSSRTSHFRSSVRQEIPEGAMVPIVLSDEERNSANLNGGKSPIVTEGFEYLLPQDEDEDYVVSLERPISVRTFGRLSTAGDHYESDETI